VPSTPVGNFLVCPSVLCWNSQELVVPNGPLAVRMEPVVRVELERVEALELLGIALAHLNVAEARVDMSPRVPLLMAIRDKLAGALQEES
jgi:hypothetical protein